MFASKFLSKSSKSRHFFLQMIVVICYKQILDNNASLGTRQYPLWWRSFVMMKAIGKPTLSYLVKIVRTTLYCKLDCKEQDGFFQKSHETSFSLARSILHLYDSVRSLNYKKNIDLGPTTLLTWLDQDLVSNTRISLEKIEKTWITNS
jgi:hypothetical protein